MADREGRSTHTTLRLDVSPEDAILRQARVGQHNLIVLGVGPAKRSFSVKWQRQSLKIQIVQSCLYQVKSGYGRGRSLRAPPMVTTRAQST